MKKKETAWNVLLYFDLFQHFMRNISKMLLILSIHEVFRCLAYKVKYLPS